MEMDFGRTVQAIAMSPDGRLLAAAEGAPSADRSVFVYETLTGRVIKKFVGYSRWATDLVFSSDGDRLLSVSEDQTGLVWDVTLSSLGGGGRSTDSPPARAWDQLATADPKLGYAGMATLTAAPDETVPLFRAKLSPPPAPTDTDLERVVNQLDAEAFADREKASAELERFGPNAVPGIKARLPRAASAELWRRLSVFLNLYDGPDPSPYQLRCARSVAILEVINTADARALLAKLAKGPADEALTQEAKASLEHLAKRSTAAP
jgi:WD40 domain-containing protein